MGEKRLPEPHAGLTAELPEAVEAMLDPAFYPHRPARVELRDSHISWVLLADDLAYKVKKPVTFPFLDYGTLDRRLHFCREEVRLNRRLAPEIYLGVRAIVRREGALALAPEGADGAVEYAVEMRRVDEGRSLAGLAERGELEAAHVDAVAERLARFHREAEVVPPERRDVAALLDSLSENHETLNEVGGSALSGARLAAAEHFTTAFVAARDDELAERAARGLMRDCHGDLRAEHAIVPERAEVYVYDCVEFNRSLREIDVSADLAFLVMDLADLGEDELSRRLVATYRTAGGDPGDEPLISFFASYWAWVRAKIACLRAVELRPDDPGRERQYEEARAQLALGHRFAWRARLPLVVAICGIAGSGKTTIARELAAASGLPHLSSDVTRKRLAGLAPTERGAEEHYAEEFSRRTYRALGEAAATEVERHGGVIADATFRRRAERDAFREGLADCPVPLAFAKCRAPAEVLLERARIRESDPGHISDAGAEIVRRQLDELEPLDEVPVSDRTNLEAERRPAEVLAELEAFLDERLGSAG